MKALVGTFNQEKALVIVQPVVEPMDRFAALMWTGIGGVMVALVLMINHISQSD